VRIIGRTIRHSSKLQQPPYSLSAQTYASTNDQKNFPDMDCHERERRL
jgi:hypothetical protein